MMWKIELESRRPASRRIRLKDGPDEGAGAGDNILSLLLYFEKMMITDS